MNDKVVKNIKIAKYIVVISNILSAILFSYSYYLIRNDILLIPLVINILVAIVAFVLFTHFEKKFRNNLIKRDFNGK
ncbi:MAG: hypothetical protein QXG00_08385 [Candidatus Woesearchaeota archaeon]